MLTKGSLKQKKPQFNSTNHDFEIQLERDSQLEVVPEDVESNAIPAVRYNVRVCARAWGIS